MYDKKWCAEIVQIKELNLAMHSEIPKECIKMTLKRQKRPNDWQKLPNTVWQSFFMSGKVVKKLQICLSKESRRKEMCLTDEIVFH